MLAPELSGEGITGPSFLVVQSCFFIQTILHAAPAAIFQRAMLLLEMFPVWLPTVLKAQQALAPVSVWPQGLSPALNLLLYSYTDLSSVPASGIGIFWSLCLECSSPSSLDSGSFSSFGPTQMPTSHRGVFCELPP